MNRSEFYTHISREHLRKILKSVETPAYIYFLPMIQQRIIELKACAAKWFDLHYAVKANPHPTILKLIATQGIGADVASTGELKAVLAQGIPAEKIEFSGPGKSKEELSEAIHKEVGSINVESIPELKLVVEICRGINFLANVGIRINPSIQTTKIGMKMAGATQFGIPETQLTEAFKIINENRDCLNFQGIHVHLGSQILEEQVLLKNIQTILDLSLKLEKDFNTQIRKINFGGGWGIDYFPHQKPLDLVKINGALQLLFQLPKYAEFASRARLILEPGRFWVGESGIYVTKVLYRKQGEIRNYLIVDGGMHQNYLIAGGLGQIIKRNFEMDVLSNLTQKSAELTFDVAGKLCTPQDILATNFQTNCDVQPDDILVFFNCGAYGFSASPLSFLSHPHPSEVIISE